MICFKCSNEEFEIRVANVRQEFRGEQFDVNTHVSVCRGCGWQTLGAGQADELRKKTVDEYRHNHHLLTSAEIIARRTALGMSQQAFADFLGIGVASVKRWESGLVQEPIYDKRIREKCDSNTFPYCVALGTNMPVLVRWEFSITTQLLNVTPYYAVQPVGISPNVSRFTSRMTGDDRLAEVSKNWRKKHSNSFDTDFIRCQ